MSGGKLKKLQRYWYKVLEDAGFVDIEEFVGDELVLKQSAAHNLSTLSPFDREMKEEYFKIITYHVSDENTWFRNEVDKLVLTMYAEGARINEIVHRLSSTGIPFLRKKFRRERKTIRIIIRRYEMLWGIRKYSHKELNRK